ncbi:hypothetical protein [Mycobacterium stomatepiae]|uniref:Uncharacterized protein n=1 Tax=Mycobacterium stomatepiae TaxID=470076 RepID=A0A7I7Q6B4_9MYCO|nr:hypothetical protein [Mycobacterium stomatepiae]MCV7162888.1 hypothetical protein [Mycobacterium stomatepiae]BBY21895.1 hypothetical protein MSTO_21000 [Mycobacterium stomatepiae]
MTEEFLAGVRSIVEPLLNELGFQLDEYDDDVVEGGANSSVVYYSSADCKIQIYESPRAASINCMIAPLDAPNVFGPSDRSGKWQYIFMLAIRQGIPRDEIRKDQLKVDFPTTIQRLEWIRGSIEKYFSVARDSILQGG